MDDNLKLIREYVQDQFVSQGMIADIAIHDPDPPNHNPHAHVMLTMRALDEQGRWLPKCHREYVLDENGDKIKGENGKWKFRKVFTTDWDNRDNAEKWRQTWEDIQNRYLEAADRPERISMKSYERQGIDQIPTVHMGPAVTAMERRGIETNIGNVGGQPYWSWYGFGSRVEWCACFVSWCANECGYIEDGIIPKYAGCGNGVDWFQERHQWIDGNEEPVPGMIIFFDWDDPDGSAGPQDGWADHTGIVERVENGIVYTVEGNSGDNCRENHYPVGHYEILGYGVPAY